MKEIPQLKWFTPYTMRRDDWTLWGSTNSILFEGQVLFSGLNEYNADRLKGILNGAYNLGVNQGLQIAMKTVEAYI
jgi:hypothetical protein